MNTKRHYFNTLHIFHPIIFLIITAILTLLMTACLLKITTPYYLPAAPGGTVVRTMQPRTNSAILFERQGVIIGVNTTTDDKDQLYVSISFEIPDDELVQLLERHIEVSIPSKDVWESELSGWVWTGPGRTKDFPLDAHMIGKNSASRFGTANGYGNTTYAAYFFKALLFAARSEKTFKIVMPKLLVNNIEAELPKIEFTLESEDLWTSLP